MPNALKFVGLPKVEGLDDAGLNVGAAGSRPDLDDDGLFSGMNKLFSSSYESPVSSFESSDSTRPSRIALATETPLMTAVKDRRYRFFSTYS